jgi:hypothetical protein
MTLKEKLKLFLDEELIEKEEYDKLIALAEDKEEPKDKSEPDVKPDVKEEPTKEGEEAEKKEPVEVPKDPHPKIEDGKEEDAEEIVKEAKTETAEEEASETPEEQAGEEDALIKANAELKAKIDEMGKAYDGLVARIETLEKTLSAMSVQKEVKDEDVGVSGKGKVANGGEAVRDDSLAMKRLLGFRD